MVDLEREICDKKRRLGNLKICSQQVSMICKLMRLILELRVSLMECWSKKRLNGNRGPKLFGLDREIRILNSFIFMLMHVRTVVLWLLATTVKGWGVRSMTISELCIEMRDHVTSRLFSSWNEK